MTTRRGFLKSAAAAAGVIFCGCGLPDSAHAATPARRPVTVNGKKARTIDVHAHCVFKEVATLMGTEAGMLSYAVKGAKEAYLTIEERTKAMDAQAIDMEVLSVNPFWYGKDRDLAAKIVSMPSAMSSSSGRTSCG